MDLQELVDLAIEAGAARQRTHVIPTPPRHGPARPDEEARISDRKLALAHVQLGDQLEELEALVREACPKMRTDAFGIPTDVGPTGWTARAERALKNKEIL